ncbi:Protein mab-21-like 3 [Acipenser ruthenus]|uniref:Protein mab-21-like 3 n=1 Tax=Acipenser ruthenus TaxID=7906 RepID=A0A662YRR8_ACIRT|nr:Protein mab-21-like 3 [Acipenser ruthenus]
MDPQQPLEASLSKVESALREPAQTELMRLEPAQMDHQPPEALLRKTEPVLLEHVQLEPAQLKPALLKPALPTRELPLQDQPMLPTANRELVVLPGPSSGEETLLMWTCEKYPGSKDWRNFKKCVSQRYLRQFFVRGYNLLKYTNSIELDIMAKKISDFLENPGLYIH